MDLNTVRFWCRRLVVAAVATIVLVLAGATSALGQVDAGSILGTVTDSSGAAVSGASVTLTNEGTGAELTATTGSEVATLANSFLVTGSVSSPAIVTVSPNSGQQGQGGPIAVVGQNTHFAQGSTQVDFGLLETLSLASGVRT